jgi:hypothetical protein
LTATAALAAGKTANVKIVNKSEWTIHEHGDECVVGGVDICGASDTWVINSKDLLACQAAGQ